jgi:hypothetical protein
MSESNCPAPAERPSRSFVDADAAIGDEPGPGLDQVTGGVARDLLPWRKCQTAAGVDVNAAACRPERRRDRLVRDQVAFDPHLAERSPWIANEEAGHDRLWSVVLGTPAVEPLRLVEAGHPHARLVPRMGDEVDGGL